MSGSDEKKKQEDWDDAKAAGAGHGLLEGRPFKPNKKETVEDFEDREQRPHSAPNSSAPTD
jgi:hypothetical protein